MVDKRISVVVPVEGLHPLYPCIQHSLHSVELSPSAKSENGSCLEAVFSQSFKPYEVILVDGHSDDGTVKRAGEFPINVLYENYGAVGGARQVGVDGAKGESIVFTYADYRGIL